MSFFNRENLIKRVLPRILPFALAGLLLLSLVCAIDGGGSEQRLDSSLAGQTRDSGEKNPPCGRWSGRAL